MKRKLYSLSNSDLIKLAKKRAKTTELPIRSHDDDEEEEHEDQPQKINPMAILAFMNKDIYELAGNHLFFRTDVTTKNIDILGKLINQKNIEFAMIKKLLPTEKIEPKPIYLHITSVGGSLLAGFMAVDMIQRSTIPIYTVIEGYAISAASLMSIAGKKKYITPHSYVLIHQLSHMLSGNYQQITEEFENDTAHMERIKDIYVKNSGGKLTKKKVTELLKHDYFFDYDKCFENGLVDEKYTHDDF